MTLQCDFPNIDRNDWFWIQIEDVTGEHALQTRVWQDKHVWEVVKKWCAAHKEHPADWRFEYRAQEISPTDEMGLPSTQTIRSLDIPLVPSPACTIKCIPLAEPEDPDPMEEPEQYSIVKLVHTYLPPLPMTFCSATTLEQILLKYCQVMDYDDQRIKVKFDHKEVRNWDKTLEEIGVEDGDVLEVL